MIEAQFLEADRVLSTQARRPSPASGEPELSWSQSFSVGSDEFAELTPLFYGPDRHHRHHGDPYTRITGTLNRDSPSTK
jgi:hypothetical protein